MSIADRRAIEQAIQDRSPLNPVRWLLRAGVVRPHHSKPYALRWPVSWAPALAKLPPYVGVFRNLPGVVRDVGTWLPRRWGFYVLGFEIGQRG